MQPLGNAALGKCSPLKIHPWEIQYLQNAAPGKCRPCKVQPLGNTPLIQSLIMTFGLSYGASNETLFEYIRVIALNVNSVIKHVINMQYNLNLLFLVTLLLYSSPELLLISSLFILYNIAVNIGNIS